MDLEIGNLRLNQIYIIFLMTYDHLLKVMSKAKIAQARKDGNHSRSAGNLFEIENAY